MATYDTLDNAIVAFIRDNPNGGHPTNSSALEKVAKPLLAYSKTPFPTPYRLICRRMTALSRAGRIVYLGSRAGWCVAGE